MKKSLQIAIDGPVAAGKSTVARTLAQRLSLLYVDTGAMYRAVAWAAKQQNTDWDDEEAISKLVANLEIRLAVPANDNDDRIVSVFVESQDISLEIRSLEMGEGASIVSQYPKVRKILVALQRQMCANNGKKGVVTEGRDIGAVVLPNADLKIYLTADPKERAKRKKSQLADMGKKVDIKEAQADVKRRDKREMTRKTEPLKPAAGAWVFDTTGFSIEEVVEKIVDRVKELGYEV